MNIVISGKSYGSVGYVFKDLVSEFGDGVRQLKDRLTWLGRCTIFPFYVLLCCISVLVCMLALIVGSLCSLYVWPLVKRVSRAIYYALVIPRS